MTTILHRHQTSARYNPDWGVVQIKNQERIVLELTLAAAEELGTAIIREAKIGRVEARI